MEYPLPNKTGTGYGPQTSGKAVVRQKIANTFINVDGYQGSMGPQGVTGVHGKPGAGGDSGNEMGYQGIQGFQGYQGLQGFQGEGEQGPLGSVGEWGSAGNQGSQGGQGFQGFYSDAGVGLQGIQGYEGGVQGSQGSQGSSFVGSQGFQAEAGVQGLQGSQGAGIEGFVGYTSNLGNQGTQGNTGNGPQGTQGIQGVQASIPGTIGVQGPQGITGYQGRTNTAGMQGAQGFQGILSADTMQFYDDFAGNLDFANYRTAGASIAAVTGAAYGAVKITAAGSDFAYLARGPVPSTATQGLINTDYKHEFRVGAAVYGSSMSGTRVVIGLINAVDTYVEGAFFIAEDGSNGGKWICRTSKNGGADVTSTATTTNPSFSNGVVFTFQELKIIRTASAYEFYIDQSLEATISTNITTLYDLFPTAYVENLTPSSSRTCYLDFIFIESLRT